MSTYELNTLAVFSDETEYYRFPVEPDEKDSVAIKIRTEKNDCDRIFIVSDNDRIEMNKAFEKGIFDFYEAVIPPSKENLKYYFEIQKGNDIYYYSRLGVSREILRYADFNIIRNFKTPAWSKNTIMYQIYVDRFFNGDKTNDVRSFEYSYLGLKVNRIKDWDRFPSAEDIRNFYGGDLQGVIEKLPYLKDLGIDAIYFNPIFVSPSNHKYDIQDYDHIDPHIGKIVNDGGRKLTRSETDNENASMYKIRTTDEKNLAASDALFAELVEKAHSMGIKIILDGVYNHCGAFNKWLDREKIYEKDGKSNGAFWSKESPYRDYFIWKDDGSYDGWWGFSNHPKLNYENSPKLMEEIMKSAEKWVLPPYNADGWRVDVAADLGQSEEFNHKFWQEFRKNIKKANPNAIILAEHYGDAAAWLDGTQWDTIMNYDAFMDPVSYFFTGMEKHSDSFRGDLYNNGSAFANAMVQKMARMPRQSLFTSMNELSNHDHSRFLTRTNMTCGRVNTKGSESAADNINIDVMKEAVLMQFTWVGSPTVYYGDEAGVVGWTDPDNRRTYPWGHENKDLINFHKEVISLRKKYKQFSEGSTMFLNEDTGIISYGRFDEKCKVIVIFNNNEDEREIEIPVWRTGSEEGNVFKKIFTAKECGNVEEKYYKVNNGKILLNIEGRNGVVIADEY